MHAVVFTGAILGVDGLTVEVEVDLSRGIPSFSIVGLPNTAVKESRERVTAAIKNSGRQFPLERITVNLAPADIKKEGATFNLAIAMGIVVAEAQKRDEGAGGADRLTKTVLLGELALDGSIRKPGLWMMLVCELLQTRPLIGLHMATTMITSASRLSNRSTATTLRVLRPAGFTRPE